MFSSPLSYPDTHSACFSKSSPHKPIQAQTKHIRGVCLQRLGRREDRKCAERWESSQKALEINGNAAKWRKERLQMSRREERRCWAPSSKCLNGCGCMQASARALFQCICCCASMCQSTCGSGGVTGGRYAMSWLTRVLLCCSVLHDWPSAVQGQPPFPLTPEL